MWKIKNELNKFVLDSFRYRFVEPLFEEVINYRLDYFNYGNILAYINSTDILYKKNKKLFVTALKRSKNGVKLYEYFDNFCSENVFYILNQYYIYLSQNFSLDNENYNVEYFVINENLKVVFVDFYYEKFIKDTKIWELIEPKYGNFNREEFHKNFCDENKLTVCPYCDIDTLNNIGNREIEHFVPKSDYPFVSMHPYNLISSCSSCNKYEGKKANYYVPIKSPFTIQYGDLVQFNIDDVNEKVSLPVIGTDYIDNYVKLLNLDERYQNKNVYDSLDGRAKSLFQIYLESERDGNKIEEILFDRYLNTRKEPLTFALKSLYESLSAYTSYKNS